MSEPKHSGNIDHSPGPGPGSDPQGANATEIIDRFAEWLADRCMARQRPRSAVGA
jgi:hypothetical protein